MYDAYRTPPLHVIAHLSDTHIRHPGDPLLRGVTDPRSTLSDLLDSLIAESVEEKLDRLAAIQEGLDDIEAGRIEDHEDVIHEVLANIHRAAAAKP